MIALVKDVRIIGSQASYLNHALNVNQNIGINQERRYFNKMELTEETKQKMKEYEEKYGKPVCRFCGEELSELITEHYKKCKLFKEKE